MDKTAVQIISKHTLVRIGPGVFYDPVECFPNGLPKGAVVGVEEEVSGWYRVIGTNWWISRKYSKVL